MAEIKYILLGLAVTTAMFCLAFAFAWTLKYYNEAALVVAFLGLSYWASRMVRDYYEN
jgi:ABC-type spermidine/putrescine transport system permease subunit I